MHLQAFAAARLAGLCICRRLQLRALQARASRLPVCLRAHGYGRAPCRPLGVYQELQAILMAR